MSQLPIGIMAKGFLHGFATLYGIFCVGCLFVFAMSFLIPEGILKIIVMMLSLFVFFGLCVAGIILKCKKSDTFSVREDYYLTIRTEGSKTPDGKRITEGTVLEEPKRYPQIDNKPKEMGGQ